MIQNVKHLAAQLESQRLADCKITMHGKIPLPSAQAANRVSPKVSLPKCEPSNRINRWINERIRVKTASRILVDEVRSGSSYISSSDMRVHFGLGKADRIEWVEARWLSGLTERFSNLGVDHIHSLKEGSGTPVEPEHKNAH